MVARSNALFVLAPQAMKVVAIVGAITALFAATIALVQNDIKRVLAYSTVSQLGYMFLALGVGAFAAGVCHLFTHTFFQTPLVLRSRSAIPAIHRGRPTPHLRSPDLSIPVTHLTQFIANFSAP